MGLRALFAPVTTYRLELSVFGVLALLIALASLAIPWLAARMLAEIIAGIDAGLAHTAVVLLAVVAGLALLCIANGLLASSLETRIEADLRVNLLGHVQRLPLGFFDHNRQGDLLALLTREISCLSSAVANALAVTPAAVLVGTGTIMILFVTHPAIACILLVLLLVFVGVLARLGVQVRSFSANVQQAEAGVFAAAADSLENMQDIKGLVREEERLGVFNQVTGKARRLKVLARKWDTVLPAATLFATACTVIAILLVLDQSEWSNRLTLAQVLSLLFYTCLLGGAVCAMAQSYLRLASAQGALGRLQHVLQEAPEAGYGPIAQSRGQGAWISFRDVWFSYRGQEDTLRSLELDIKSGEIVGLAGDVGAGKTTIAQLLMGFYQPRHGQILLNGVDISTMNVRELRQSIGYVPERPILQCGTVRDNLLLGLENVTEAAIEQACGLAQAHDFIIGLPKGYHTETGDRGVRLSQGERKRIALARILLRNSPIIILDGIAGICDHDDGAALLHACRGTLADRTVILISRRVQNLAFADRILMLANGGINTVARRPSLISIASDEPTRGRGANAVVRNS